jgi:hypothetical protein
MPYVWGVLVATLMPIIPLWRLGVLLWRTVAFDEGVAQEIADPAHRIDLPLLVGVLERILYVSAWLFGAVEFIGIWLALKVAGGWKAWSEGRDLPGDKPNKKVTVPGRYILNVFLLGNGLSIMGALAGVLLIEAYAVHRITRGWQIVGLVTLGIVVFWLWAEIRWHLRAHPKKSSA